MLKVIYIGDPLCSWCYGFSDVLSKLREKYVDLIDFELVVGGLRVKPNLEKMDANLQKLLSHHWDRVQQVTGKEFNKEFLKRENFIYDTEPACQSVVTVRKISKENVFNYMEALHESFYKDNFDPTDMETFKMLGKRFGIPESEFEKTFYKKETIMETKEDFEKAKSWGVRGFPALIVNEEKFCEFITEGYRPFEELDTVLEIYTETRNYEYITDPAILDQDTRMC